MSSSSSSSTLAMKSLPKVHLHSHRHFSLSLPFSSLSFPSLPRPPSFSSSSLRFSPIRASSSPKHPPFRKPHNSFSLLLQALNPLFSPLFEPVYIAFAATLFFFIRIQLKPAISAPAIVPPAADSASVTEDSTAVVEDSPAVADKDNSDEENERAIDEQLRNNPNDADTIRSLVEIKVRARKIDEAIQGVDRLIELEPEVIELLLLKAHLYSHNGEHELARNVFEEMLTKDPFCAEAYHGLLMATLQLDEPTDDLLKRIEEAVKLCEKQNGGSEAREFKLLLAQIKVMEEDYSGALKVYQELVKEDSRDFRPYLCQGVVYTLLRKKDEAEKQFEKYRKLVPENHPYKEYFEDNTKIFAQKLEKRGLGVKS